MRNGLIEHLQDLLADFGRVSTRPMFGGHGVYRDDVLIGIVIDGTLYLRSTRKPDRYSRPPAARLASIRDSGRRSR